MIACCRLRRFANPRALALPTSLRASDLNPPTSRQRLWGNLGMIGLSSLSAPPLERKLSNVPTSTVDRDSANQTRRRIVDYLICVVTDVGITVDGGRSSPTPYSTVITQRGVPDSARLPSIQTWVGLEVLVGFFRSMRIERSFCLCRAGWLGRASRMPELG
jgi:hypothetical protein